jgi:hypothetical protein
VRFAGRLLRVREPFEERNTGASSSRRERGFSCCPRMGRKPGYHRHYCRPIFGRIDRRARLALLGRVLGRLESRYWFLSQGGAVVARVAVQLLARSIRRAGFMTRGPGPPCWACWKSEKCAHLARLHASCMAVRPFARWSGQKWRAACNRWAVACTARGGLASSALGRLA